MVIPKEISRIRVTIVGIGYVGLSLAVLLSRFCSVRAIDIDEGKVRMVNERKSPIADHEIEEFLAEKDLDLTASVPPVKDYRNTEFLIIATPTDYDSEQKFFDTSSVESVIETAVKNNFEGTVVIKSTVPVGFTEKVSKRFGARNILFSPEFLRESRALYDNLHPSRIIIGIPGCDETEHLRQKAERFAGLLQQGADDENVPALFMGSTEAEAVKLFANTYLALRVAYFNELDSYAEMRNLSAGDIIKGVSLDPRIGDFYNNPSFGYGGYCLPKDTKQLLANYFAVPQNLISAIVEANRTRKDHITDVVMAYKPSLVGIYRLTMKERSDNFRHSAVQGIMKRLRAEGVPLIVYEPMLETDTFCGNEVIHNLDMFKERCDLILANRWADELEDVKAKVYTRDLFRRD